jgi:hypothetical protein
LPVVRSTTANSKRPTHAHECAPGYCTAVLQRVHRGTASQLASPCLAPHPTLSGLALVGMKTACNLAYQHITTNPGQHTKHHLHPPAHDQSHVQDHNWRREEGLKTACHAMASVFFTVSCTVSFNGHARTCSAGRQCSLCAHGAKRGQNRVPGQTRGGRTTSWVVVVVAHGESS